MMADDASAALVLFSGGQDLATCLAWALDRFDSVETIGFDYGQRHRVELDCRDKIRAGIKKINSRWAARLADDHLLSLDALGRISDTALTREAEIRIGEEGLPTTFVPGRNLMFFMLAAAVGFRRGLRHLVGGMCETDYSGYPDCRDDTIKALQVALNLGMNCRFVLHTPLDVAGQERDLAPCHHAWRQRIRRTAAGSFAQLLLWRPHGASRLGLWMRQVPGVRIAGERIPPLHRRTGRLSHQRGSSTRRVPLTRRRRCRFVSDLSPQAGRGDVKLRASRPTR